MSISTNETAARSSGQVQAQVDALLGITENLEGVFEALSQRVDVVVDHSPKASDATGKGETPQAPLCMLAATLRDIHNRLEKLYHAMANLRISIEL